MAMFSQRQKGSGQPIIGNYELLSGQSDIFATTFTNNHLLLLQTTNLSWVSEKYPLIMTELAVVHVGSLELDPFEWTVIHKDGHKHLNADAMSRRPADTGPTDQSSSCTPPASAQPDVRNSSPVSPSCSVSSVHFHNSCIPDPEPVSSNQITPPPSSDLQRASRSVSSICVLQLPEDNLKKEQQKDPILLEVISWKTKGLKPPYCRMRKRTTDSSVCVVS